MNTLSYNYIGKFQVPISDNIIIYVYACTILIPMQRFYFIFTIPQIRYNIIFLHPPLVFKIIVLQYENYFNTEIMTYLLLDDVQ